MSFVSNRPRFLVRFTINELENIPQKTGYISCRWYMKDHRPKPKYRGKTKWAPIRDHRANFENYTEEFTTRIRMAHRSSADAPGTPSEGHAHETRAKCLTECLVVFELYLEYSLKENKTLIGKVEINMSEYAQTNEIVTNRYLLHESKVNSVLNLSIYVEQIKGETDFAVPPMKTSHIFDGISTLLDDQRDRLTAGSATTITHGPGNNPPAPVNPPFQYNLHDIYKRSLAHSLHMSHKKILPHSSNKSGANTPPVVHSAPVPASPVGVTLTLALNQDKAATMKLPDDATHMSPYDCIEDIFAGGDGFGNLYQGGNNNDNEFNTGGYNLRSPGSPKMISCPPPIQRRAYNEPILRENSNGPSKMAVTTIFNNNNTNNYNYQYSSNQNLPQDHHGPLQHRSSQQRLQQLQQLHQLQQRQLLLQQQLQLQEQHYNPNEIPWIDQKNKEKYLEPYENADSHTCWTIRQH